MKAYYAYENNYEYSTIVFAENVSQAKTLAMWSEQFEDVPYIDIRVQRMKEADNLYKGRSEIDWDNEDTRLVLVRDFSWACYEPSWECDTCSAKAYCRWREEED